MSSGKNICLDLLKKIVLFRAFRELLLALSEESPRPVLTIATLEYGLITF